MLRGAKRVWSRVAVLPTMAALPTADVCGPPLPAHSARRDAATSRGRIGTANLAHGFGPTRAPTTDKPATAPLPNGKPAMPARNKPAAMAPPHDEPDDARPARRWLNATLIVASLGVAAAGWSYRSKVDDYAGLTMPPATRAGDDLMQVRQALQRERDKAEKLTDELRLQAATMANRNAAKDHELNELRQALQQAEASAAAYQEMLAHERARNQDLQQQLTTRRDTPSPGHSRDATASLSETPGPTPASAPAADKPATAPLLTNDKPVILTDGTPATTAARLVASEAPGNPEALRLMARASLLLGQGNVSAARIVLDRAAETGSAPALFALAETYDPLILSAWGTMGTRGDAAKARELYAKAFAGGIREAGERLNALRE
jgi:hypothetical protein